MESKTLETKAPTQVTDDYSERLFQTLRAYIDGQIASTVARRVSAASVERESQLVNLVSAMDVKINSLMYQAERTKEHVANLERKYKALRDA